MIILLKEDGRFISTPEINRALDNISYQCRSGNHVLMGDRELLLRIAESPDLESRSIAIIRQAAQRMTQQGSLLKRSPWVLEIDVSNTSVTRPHLSSFSEPDFCEKAQLLTENPTDSTALASLAEGYIQSELSGYRLSIRCNNGGGSTIASTLRQLTDTPSGCVLCVVDSDRAFDGAALGATARAAKSVHCRIRPTWRSSLHIIEQRELENIIPTDIKEHCILRYAPHLIENSRKIDLTNPFYTDYFCLKNGDSMCRVVSSMIAKRQIRRLPAALAASSDSPLDDEQSCGTCSNDNSCKRSIGFGAGFLGWVSEELRSRRVISDSSEWRDELKALVEKVVFFGIGNQPVRT